MSSQNTAHTSSQEASQKTFIGQHTEEDLKAFSQLSLANKMNTGITHDLDDPDNDNDGVPHLSPGQRHAAAIDFNNMLMSEMRAACEASWRNGDLSDQMRMFADVDEDASNSSIESA
ncbi:hypothetical protein DACRYDRAFT_112015 [Dacryopinax primogenitus]|uniref:Uncharacterized protein n=1 Tax=Dacryopinax primogenitus (strain DJM 731) TaxID=1858805 RepID=M5FZW4_DACPD|nr:uncharacterized protein DACRYDRAFT_112015 [Dacryopinax primogenitus]EJT97052.1 hypothetical protein DACRYDRAFT_112015 [Dacryopinax primogenitus]